MKKILSWAVIEKFVQGQHKTLTAFFLRDILKVDQFKMVCFMAVLNVLNKTIIVTFFFYQRL